MSQDDRILFGQEHVDRYRETDGEVGHDWRGAPTLLLTTTGRRSGDEHTAPLIYQPVGDDAYAIVDYDAYQQRTEREIPVVVLERSS